MIRAFILLLAACLLALPARAMAESPAGKRYGLSPDEAVEAVRRGEGRQALEFYQRLAAELESKGARVEAGRVHSLAATVATRVGALQQSIRFGLRALELLKDQSRTIDDLRTRVGLYNTVAIAYRVAGDLKESQRYLREGLEMVRAHANLPPSAAWTGGFLRNLAANALDQGQHSEALGYAEEAVRFLERALAGHGRGPRMPAQIREFNQVQLARSLVLAGRAHLSMGNLAAAEAPLNRALADAKASGLAEAELDALTSLGSVALTKKDYALALNYFNQALALATRSDTVTLMVRLYQFIGRAYAGQGRVEEALAAVRQSLRLVEDVRSQLQESGLRSGYLEDKQRIYQQAVSLALAAGKPEEAFRFAEGSRARAFLDLLGNQTTLSKGKTRVLVEEEVRLRARLNEIRAEAEETASDAARTRARRLAEAAERDYRAFLERVKKENIEQASLMTVEPLTIQEVQALLPEGTTLLEYLVAATEVVVWVIDRQQAKVLRLPGGRAALVGQVREFRAAIAQQAPIEQIQERSRRLYDRLLALARPEIRGGRLLIVPHDVLHYLPFPALRTPEGRWLVEDYTLATLPSASVLKFLAGKGERVSDQALAVGNPDVGAGLNLRYAEREARLVSQRYPATTVLVRREATEARVKALSPQAGLLHFATHGELSEGDPLASALLLVPEGAEDGRLEVRELFGIELNARLVVLSACETGLGKLSRGDELVGLQRAFLYAGTPAVITTLWKVDDRASFLLMRAFYDELKQGRGPAEALRQAQSAAAREFPHPFAWAAFGLTGVPR